MQEQSSLSSVQKSPDQRLYKSRRYEKQFKKERRKKRKEKRKRRRKEGKKLLDITKEN